MKVGLVRVWPTQPFLCSVPHRRLQKNLMCPSPPNRGTATRKEVPPNSRVECENAKQSRSKASPCIPIGILANCGKLHMAAIMDGHEFKAHLMGSLERGPSQHACAVPWAGSLQDTLRRHQGNAARMRWCAAARILYPVPQVCGRVPRVVGGGANLLLAVGLSNEI